MEMSISKLPSLKEIQLSRSGFVTKKRVGGQIPTRQRGLSPKFICVVTIFGLILQERVSLVSEVDDLAVRWAGESSKKGQKAKRLHGVSGAYILPCLQVCSDNVVVEKCGREGKRVLQHSPEHGGMMLELDPKQHSPPVRFFLSCGSMMSPNWIIPKYYPVSSSFGHDKSTHVLM